MVIAIWHSTILNVLNSSILGWGFFCFVLFFLDRHICCNTHKVSLPTELVWFGFYVLTSSKKRDMTSFNYSHKLLSSLTITLWLRSEVFLAFTMYKNYKPSHILLFLENSIDHKHRKGKHKTCSILTAVLQRMKKKM